MHLESTSKKESQVYQSMGFHYHAKSEHKINGVQYDSEMQIVFVKKPSSIPLTSFSEMEDKISVIGILFQIDELNANESNRSLITSFLPEKPKVLLNFYQKNELFIILLLKRNPF